MPTGTGLPLCHEYICRGASCQEHCGIMFLMAIPVALCLRNSGSQTPDCWLKLDRNTHFALNGIWGSGKSFVLDMFEEKLSEIQSEETSTDKYFIVRSYASCKSTCGSQPRFRNFLDDKRNLTSGAYPKLEIFSGIS